MAFQRGENSLTRPTYEEEMKYHLRGLFCQIVKNRQPEKFAKVYSIQEEELNS